jgi:hypothetical protein
MAGRRDIPRCQFNGMLPPHSSGYRSAGVLLELWLLALHGLRHPLTLEQGDVMQLPEIFDDMHGVWAEIFDQAEESEYREWAPPFDGGFMLWVILFCPLPCVCRQPSRYCFVVGAGCWRWSVLVRLAVSWVSSRRVLVVQIAPMLVKYHALETFALETWQVAPVAAPMALIPDVH